MALALQEQLNMEDSGGNAATMAYQAGQPMAVAPAAMIGRLTGKLIHVGSHESRVATVNLLITWQERCVLPSYDCKMLKLLINLFYSQSPLLRRSWPRTTALPEWIHTAASASATPSTRRRHVRTARRNPSGTRPSLAISTRYDTRT